MCGPGSRIHREHEDTISISLTPQQQELLGRVVIDATRAPFCGVGEPGIRIALGAGRLIHFGRAPATDEPGELPVDLKWRSVAGALALMGAAPHDWDLLDVRWDRPDLVLRHPPQTPGPSGPNGAPADRERRAAAPAPWETRAPEPGRTSRVASRPTAGRSGRVR